MYIVIAGGGLLGKGLARKLVSGKHDVVVIDLDQNVCEEVYARYGAIAICGNAATLEVLEQARIDKCDVAVAVMRKDSDNLAFALLAKHFKVKQILVSMVNPKYEEVYKSAGVTNIARATELLIDQLIVNIESPELRKVVAIGDLEIVIINIPENSSYAGLSLSELRQTNNFPKKLNVTCIFNDSSSSFIVPCGLTKIEAKDRLFICGRKKELKKVSKLISNS